MTCRQEFSQTNDNLYCIIMVFLATNCKYKMDCTQLLNFKKLILWYFVELFPINVPTRKGRGLSAKSRVPYWPFLGKPNFEIR